MRRHDLRPARIVKEAIVTVIRSHHHHSRSNSSRLILPRTCLLRRVVDFHLVCIRKISFHRTDMDRLRLFQVVVQEAQVPSHQHRFISLWVA